MSNMELAAPCDSFGIHKNVHTLMILTGIYKLYSPNPYLRRLHSVYRIIVLIFILTLNIQRIIKICLTVYNVDNAALPLFIEEISEFNFFWKLMTVRLNQSKLRDVHMLIKDKIFAVETERDEMYFKQYKTRSSRIFALVMCCLIMTLLIWITNLVTNRIEDPTFVVPLYYPFEVSSPNRFIFSMVWGTMEGVWSVFGHYGLDCMIITYYLQATYQLKSLKYKLQHIYDDNNAVVRNEDAEGRFKFMDEIDPDLKNRFINCVRKYERISWYGNEINNALNLGISMNFMTLSLAICFIIYYMSSAPVFSFEFAFMFFALIIFQSENYLYCYHGQLVQNESETINTAIYFSDWLSVSPKFRRQILIAMCRWHYRLIPKFLNVIPISLPTLVWITRTSYSIYTVLSSSERQ